jgi:hypothetical protein
MNFIYPGLLKQLNVFLFLFFCSVFVNFCDGQNNQPPLEVVSKKDPPFLHYYGKNPPPQMQAVYFEAFGNSANLYSLNYERCLVLKKCRSYKWCRYSLRVGVNYFMEKLAVPMMMHFSKGDDFCFEAGGGWVPWFSAQKRVDGVAMFSGFRYQPGRTGLMARFAITPTYLVGQKNHWRMIFGFSCGWAF